MAHEIPIQNTSLVAAADYSAKQYYAMKVSSAGLATICGAGENALGILQDKPLSGEVANIMVLGESKAIYGASVTAGANLMTDASGRLITATGTNPVIGVAKESGAVNEIHTVYLVTRTSSGANTKSVVTIPVSAMTALANGDYLTNYTPGFAGSITKFSFAVTVPVTTAAKAATVNLEIGTTNVTGGVISLTSANCTPQGAVVDGTAITALNTFTASDTISIEVSGVTAFIEGAGYFLIVLG